MEDIKDNKCFFDKINLFIAISKNSNNSDIKSEYLKLVKEYHPDRNPDNKMANEYMIILNYVYGQLLNNKQFTLNITDEYDKNKIDGKYRFVNERGITELITEKPVYLYKLGKGEYDKAVCILIENPSDGDNEKTGYTIIGHLYRSYRYFREVIALDKDGIWKKAAEEKMLAAYKMNERITRGLSKTNEKGITKI